MAYILVYHGLVFYGFWRVDKIFQLLVSLYLGSQIFSVMSLLSFISVRVLQILSEIELVGSWSSLV